jgi:hypothetical protein
MPEGQRFPYVSVNNLRGEEALRPQLPISLVYHGQAVNAAGLLDTGADVNVLPYHIGIELGAIWAEQRTAVELSGNLAAFEARGIIITAVVGQFAPIQLAFAWTQAEHVPLLLGQVNFFMEFNVCFYRSEGDFEVFPKISG